MFIAIDAEPNHEGHQIGRPIQGYRVQYDRKLPGGRPGHFGDTTKAERNPGISRCTVKLWDNSNLAVSHDELDAVTAAIVGLYYLRGDFEALGTLIIPVPVPREVY